MDQETQDKIIQHISEYSPEFKKSMRRQYLLGYYRKAFNKQYLKSKKYISDTVIKTLYFMEMQDKAIEKGDLAAVVIITGKIKELVGVLVKAQSSAYFRRHGMKDEITYGMIVRAKAYPFEKLIEVKRNKALCPFHGEKTPSFSIKDNRGHCFGCHWKGDTVDFIMQKEGLTFPEAVRKLC